MILALFLLLAAPARAEALKLKASDGVAVAADYVRPARGKPVIMLLHGLGAGRGEWTAFASSLAARGWGSLALDARGHGESGGPRYTEFRGPADWDKVALDLEAAAAWLEKAGHPRRRIILGGASIGANIVLRAAARDPRVPLAMLFSPGMDYQGVSIAEPAQAFDRPLLLAAAPEDVYAYRTCLALAPRLKSPASKRLEAGRGHGASMLSGPENQAFVSELFGWMEKALSAGRRSPPGR